MAKKLNLDSVNTGKLDTGITDGETFDNAESSGKSKSRQQSAASKEEQEERIAQGRTQGRKNCKMPRINLSFDSENYDFIRVMSRITGQSMTAFINQVMTAYREEHNELYEQAKEFYKELSGDGD